MGDRGVGASNNAFAGGAQQRNLYPPGVGGAIGSANTRVSAPVAGVAPTPIKSARPNEGSNIGIPYSRLVPLNNSNKLISQDAQGKTVVRRETEDLRPTAIAFILGLRGDSKPPRPLLDGYEQAPGIPGYNVGYQPNIMPGMPGTERFQQLCSMEYLGEYFKQVLAGKAITLGKGYNEQVDAMPLTLRTTGPIGVLKAAQGQAEKAGIPGGQPGHPVVPIGASMMDMPDLTKEMALAGSDAREAQPNYQGIFARDFGPFLKGKGSATALVDCTVGNLPQLYNPSNPDDKKRFTMQPFSMSRNFGDEVAFALLDAKLLENGLTDWRPDGIVLSKGINDPSDKLSDEYLEARDGQLFNVRVQGPAIGTSWTDDRSMEVLPLDKVFVAIVADVWFDVDALTGEDASVAPGPDGKGGRTSTDTIKSLLGDGREMKTTEEVESYKVLRSKSLAKPLDEEAFKAKQVASFKGKANESTVLANFRVMVSTSSQMINHSAYKYKGNQMSDSTGKRRRLMGSSRMGLTLANDVGEYVIGGWQIGNVLDTAASRAAMPQGVNLGIRSTPNSAAMNINVNISWFNADRLCRSFNNTESELNQRFEAVKRQRKNPVNMQWSATQLDDTTASVAPDALAAVAAMA